MMDRSELARLSAEELIAKRDSIEEEIRKHHELLDTVRSHGSAASAAMMFVNYRLHVMSHERTGKCLQVKSYDHIPGTKITTWQLSLALPTIYLFEYRARLLHWLSQD